MLPRQVVPAFGVCLVLKLLGCDRRTGEDGCPRLWPLSSLSWRTLWTHDAHPEEVLVTDTHISSANSVSTHVICESGIITPTLQMRKRSQEG